MSKKMMSIVLGICLIITCIFVGNRETTKAAVMSSSWYNSKGLGQYEVDIRKDGSTEILGRLTIYRKSDGAYATFYNSGTSCKKDGSYTAAKHAYSADPATSFAWSGNYQTAYYKAVNPTNAYGKVHMVY